MALGGLAVALVSSGLTRWLATAALLCTAAPLLRLVARRPWWQARRDRLPLVLLLALAVLLLGPLLAGQPPASRDHGIHYFQIRMLVEEMLPSGRLWGWSPTLNHGYPYGESYPVLGYLWMAAAHLLSFGLVPLRTSYAWGLAALWMLSAAVAWWLAASITRELRPAAADPHDDPRRDASTRPIDVAGWAGLVAAALWLLDPGASRQGGWNYLMFHGVWPQMLAATLWAASLGLTWRALARPTPRRLALAALALGGSLWAHPFGLLTAAASGFGFAVVIVAAPGAGAYPGPWRTWAIVHLGAAMLGAAWLAAFFASAESMARAPVPWLPLAELSSDLLQGTLLSGQWAWAGLLVLGGAAVVIRRGDARGLGVLGLVAILVVLGSEEAISVLRLDLLLSGFKNLQFPRYSIPLKPLWFVLAGVGAGQAIAWAQGRRSGSGTAADAPEGATEGEPGPAPAWDASSWMRRGALALLLAPLVATVVPDAGRLLARPVGALDTLESAQLAEAEAGLLAALRAEAAALPPERPLTVAVMRDKMGGATYPIATVADAGGRLALDSHIPTVNFKHRLRRRPAAYASLGVTHVIHDRPIPDKETALAAAVETVGRYGPFTLERFVAPGDRARRVAQVRGPGTVEIIDDSAERLELELTGVDDGSMLIIGRAPHGRWEATLDGEPLELRPRSLDDHGLSGMSAAVVRPGRVVLRYVYAPHEARAKWLSAAALLLALAALGFGRPALVSRPRSPSARRVEWIVAGLGVVAVLSWGARRQASKLRQTWSAVAVDELGDDDEDPTAVLDRDLVIEDGLVVQRDPERVCSGLLGKDVLADCSEAAHRPSTSFLYREPFLYRCLRLSLPPHGSAVVRLPVLPDDETVVVGTVLRHVRTGSGARLRWGLGDDARGPLRNTAHDFVASRDGQGRTPSIKLRNDGDAIEQVCISAAQMRRPLE